MPSENEYRDMPVTTEYEAIQKLRWGPHHYNDPVAIAIDGKYALGYVFYKNWESKTVMVATGKSWDEAFYNLDWAEAIEENRKRDTRIARKRALIREHEMGEAGWFKRMLMRIGIV